MTAWVTSLRRLRQAWRMFQSDDTAETVIAVALVAAVVGPLVWAAVVDGE